jgi:precorrin-3B synthase
MLLVEGLAAMPALAGLVTRAGDPLRRVEACSGAPACLQALAPVRGLAERLAPQVPQGKVLHLSGCAKGCAHPAPADFTLVATAQGFDLIRNGTTLDAPLLRGLAQDDIDLKGLS